MNTHLLREINSIKYNVHAYYLLLFIFFSILNFLFLSQFFSGNLIPSGLYRSDTPSHISSIYHETYYSAFHYFIYTIGEWTEFFPEKYTFYGVLHSILLSLITVLTIGLVRNFFGSESFAKDFFAIASVFVAMIILDPHGEVLFVNSGTGNTWHNGTYVATKIFSFLSFLFLLKAIKQSIQGERWLWSSVGYFFSILLSTWIKPTFVLSFFPAILIVFTYMLYIGKMKYSFYFSIGLFSLISLLPLYIVNASVFESSEYGIRVVFGELWYLNTDSIISSLLLSLAFPLFVYGVKFHDLSFASKLSLANLVGAITLYFFFVEDGPRFNDGNFAWPFIFAIFLSFVTTIRDFFFSDSKKNVVFYIGSLLFFLHLVSGVFYFLKIFVGYSYL
ncbi:hypothetical protein L1D24_18150 [Vibrio brasiliensis]|uniref:hypothetical protein n=1 Tax=Vibrio brasiliensis TaxID=170652 RepID=UPI001EFEC4E1|nr:hypothetical protein [Vibrio brasiliensis]MCG9650475.1 hypothetical protein [Vibrio brasiliensis]